MQQIGDGGAAAAAMDALDKAEVETGESRRQSGVTHVQFRQVARVYHPEYGKMNLLKSRTTPVNAKQLLT